MKTLPQSTLRNTGQSRPCRKASGLAFVFDYAVVSFVACLRGAIRPSAIARLVVAVVVDAVNFGVRERTLPHIGQELSKRIMPCIANVDAAPSIVLVVFVVLFAAPRPHEAPYAILRRPGHAVCSVDVAGGLQFQASATAGVAFAKRPSGYGSCFAAIANALPECFTIVVAPNTTHDREASESLTGQFRGGGFHRSSAEL